MSYDLWYWPEIEGRGEFVRLVLEGAGIPYRDRAREDGLDALLADRASRTGFAPFAPPYLVDGDFAIAQVAHILAWLTDRHGLGSGDLATDLQLIQLQLTITDIVAEAHNVHHPVAVDKYYHEQKDEAVRAAASSGPRACPGISPTSKPHWASTRARSCSATTGATSTPRCSSWSKGCATCSPGGWPDSSPPTPASTRCATRWPGIDRIAAYLASGRRIPFNEDGLFRHYPELDAA